MAVLGQGENNLELAVGSLDASSAEPSDAAHRLSALLRGALLNIYFWDNFGPGQFYCRSCCSILLATMRPGTARCPSDAPIAEVRCHPRHPIASWVPWPFRAYRSYRFTKPTYVPTTLYRDGC